MNIEDETTEGDPWSVLPIKTRKYANECKEIVLSNRKINKLINFDKFENLEALWLTNNKLERLVDMDKNFRLKILCVGNNRITTLEGSLYHMKFLQMLFLNNNKLRNLDINLMILKEFSFLKNLNLFGNPLAEEPEYRNRVIHYLPSLEIFDRHSNYLNIKIFKGFKLFI
jgi:Leucine-rich repeat (LRR) protein